MRSALATHAIRATIGSLALIAGLASSSRAQAPAGFDTLSARAAAESLTVMTDLTRRVRNNPKDAASQYRLGMIAFALSERARDTVNVIPNLNSGRLRIVASDALRAALDLEPGNRTFKHAVEDFALTDCTPSGRLSARPVICDANLEHYATEPDSSERLRQMLANGWVCWLDYDGYANRALSSFADDAREIPDLSSRDARDAQKTPPTNAAPSSVYSAVTIPKSAYSGGSPPDQLPVGAIMQYAIDTVLATLSNMPFDVAGETDYLRAKVLFESARALAPADERTFWRLAMLLSARSNWSELRELGRTQTRVVPADAWGWMAFALGTYRMQPGKEATELFDTAFARLSARDRSRLDHIERVLRPTDSTSFRRAPAETREAMERTTWMLADPLWSSAQANPRVEFLARVAYAELRWSLSDRSIGGANTDRGDIYIRYGPPKKMLGFWPESGHVTHEFWVYNANLIFAFSKLMHQGTAFFAPADVGIVDLVKEWQPARWDNIATSRIDSMPTQVARFRAVHDSVDIFLATVAPVDTFRKHTVANVAPIAHMWLFKRGATEAYEDSVSLPGSGSLQWTRRVSAGNYYYRVEAMIPGTLVASRTTATMTAGTDTAGGFNVIGYGLSDILIAKTAKSAATPRRWSDLDVIPMLGDIPKGAEVALVWENYELGQQNGSAEYDVVVTMERERGKRGRVTTQLLGFLGNSVGVTSTGDKSSMRFQRTVAFSPVITENVTLALRDTPPGTYRLSVQVTDRISKRVTSRPMRVVIHE